ncbi:MAG: hypothetical protein LC754_14190 [Acidobacteria bacterium]|nr:hypothetical protein [Acidobacteriota bacterium]
MSKRNSSGAKQAILVALCIAAGVPLLLVVWSKTTLLLNARSDASVLLGLSVVIMALTFIGLLVFLILRKLVHGQEPRNRRDEERQTLPDAAEPKSLFSESVNLVENLYEDRRTKIRRE